MKTVVYVHQTGNEEYVNLQLKEVEKYPHDELVIENENDSKDAKKINRLLDELSEGDRIVVYQLRSLGKSIIQLADFLGKLDDKGISLVVIEKDKEFNGLDNDVYLNLVKRIAETEKIIIKERTTKGLEEARKNGRIGGRPKISQEKINQIRFLYNNNRYTLRQIAEECNISLGTAYKYVQER